MRKILTIVFALMVTIGAVFSAPVVAFSVEDIPAMPVMFTGIAAISPLSTYDNFVYTAEGDKLFYHGETGTLFTEHGVVYDKTSTPLGYVSPTGAFSNEKNQALEILKEAGRNYLVNGDYKVRSQGWSDNLFLCSISGTLTYVTRQTHYRKFLGIILWNTATYKYYDFFGHDVTGKLDKTDYFTHGKILGFGQTAGSNTLKIYNATTYKDLWEAVKINDDIEDIARCPVSNIPLVDDYGNYIHIADNGQLVDAMRLPLIGADARPILFENNQYLSCKTGQPLTIKVNNLVGSRSVTKELSEGTRLYFLYLKNSKQGSEVLTPVYGVDVSTSKGRKIVYYFLNGDEATNELDLPVDVDWSDREQNFDDFRTDFELFMISVKEFFADIGGFFSDIWAGIKEFFAQAWMYIVLGVVVIVLLVTFPVTFPIIMTVLKAIWFVVSAPFRVVVWLFSRK